MCTDLDWTLLYILNLRTHTTFVWKNKMLALGGCLPQPCSSAGRRFAASRSRLQYSSFPRGWNSKWSSEYKTKSSMFITGSFSNGSFEKRLQLSPSRISFCILITISSLIFSGTSCTTDESFRFHNNKFHEMRCKLDSTWKSAFVPEIPNPTLN